MKKWLPILITIGLGSLSQFQPEITHQISQHPNLALGLGTAVAVIKGLLPSPVLDGDR